MNHLHSEKEWPGKETTGKSRFVKDKTEMNIHGKLITMLVLCVLLAGSRIYASATESGNFGETRNTEAVESQESSLEARETEDKRVENDTEELAGEDGEHGTELTEYAEGTEITTENDAGTEEETEAGNKKRKEEVLDEVEEVQDAEQQEYGGLYYYLNKYAYDSKARYLEEYINYMEKQQKAYEEMYKQGKTTAVEVKNNDAQCRLVRAELVATENESAYYAFYLDEKKIDCSGYSIKEAYDVHSLEYYRENYPGKDSLTICRYVTDYSNASAYVKAKEAEITAIQEKLKTMELLYKEGEVSELSLLQEQVSLARAEYEKTQYQVDMGKAYCNISLICK